jgi:hypothetical protein
MSPMALLILSLQVSAAKEARSRLSILAQVQRSDSKNTCWNSAGGAGLMQTDKCSGMLRRSNLHSIISTSNGDLRYGRQNRSGHR